jgi:hypothetical protein
MQELTAGNAGWVRCAVDGRVLYLRLCPDARGRWVVREMVLDASEGDAITPRAMVKLPLASIESFVNTDTPTRDYLRDHVDTGSPVGGPASGGSNVAVLVSHFATTFGPKTDPARNWAAAAQESTMPGAQRVRKQRPPRRVPPDTSYRLSAPTAGLTPEFLGNVGRAYAAAVARGEAPNKTLASDAMVPIRSIERWVYLARKSGIMPPARKGSRG